MRVYLDTVGCRLNQAEIESMACQFRAAGHEIVGAAEHADLAVVNTCTVTTDAAADSRALIRRLGGLDAKRVVATGCWATLHRAEALGLPGVVRLVPNAAKHALVPVVLGSDRELRRPGAQSRQPLPGQLHRTRAFIKVQDGCDNHCAFCVTTIARGRARSRPIPDVIADVRGAEEGGSKEVVLTGVQLGSWGEDFGLRLKALVRAILVDTDIPRLRLSSLEPWNLDEDFLDLWADPRMCRHLHLPLQSGCEATLQRMSRRTTPDLFRELLGGVRSQLPDVAITTDIIAGFPGETEDEFQQSLDFAREMGFAGGHAFTFSPMAHTAAARMPGQVPLETRRRRTRSYRQLFEGSGLAFRGDQLGTSRMVLWESAHETPSGAWTLRGLTDNNVRVLAEAPASRWNVLDAVLLSAEADGHVRGRILESG